MTLSRCFILLRFSSVSLNQGKQCFHTSLWCYEGTLGTVTSPKFCGRDEWIGLYTDLTATRAGTRFCACLHQRFETDNMFIITPVGSGDGMYLEPVAVTELHAIKHKVVLIKHKSKCLSLLWCFGQFRSVGRQHSLIQSAPQGGYHLDANVSIGHD